MSGSRTSEEFHDMGVAMDAAGYTDDRSWDTPAPPEFVEFLDRWKHHDDEV